ncbi:hypothetical protein [Streptomyces sp. XY431]|uniref:hypothetical protein n=1 Tax=Streptomyces sp. XY431 TaxID=1415562 RepID=UPI0006AF91E8|nr:hypothetical protein [Streptomyces sp. XY431]
MVNGTGNPELRAWVQASGLTFGEIARRTTAPAQRNGHRQVAPDTTRVRRRLDGERPRPAVPDLPAQVLGEHLGRSLTPSDLGPVPTCVALDTLQVPLLDEPAPATLAGRTRMDPLTPHRREILTLAATTLITLAEHLLGGTSRALARSTTGFDADSTTTLEGGRPNPRAVRPPRGSGSDGVGRAQVRIRRQQLRWAVSGDCRDRRHLSAAPCPLSGAHDRRAVQEPPRH